LTGDFVPIEREAVKTLLFPVPLRDRPPTLDGHIESGEWERACAITGFLGLSSKEYSHRQGTFWLAYDAGSIYFAYQSSFPPGTQEGGAWDEKALRAFARDRDGSVFLDDSIEIFLAPESPDRYIQFIANCLGTINDRRYGEISWDGDWQICSRVDDTAGIWELEGAVSFASLGVPAPDVGDSWFFNIARSWKGMENLLTSATGEYRKQMARIAFVDAAPAIQERSWGQPLAGLPALDLAVCAGARGGARVDVEWVIHDETGQPSAPASEGQALEIAAGQSHLLQRELGAATEGQYTIGVVVRDAATHAPLYERALPFSVGQPVTLKPFYVLKTQTLGVLTDLTRMPLNPLTDCQRIEFTVTAGGRSVATKSLEVLEREQFGVEFDFEPPPGMELSIVCRFVARDGVKFEAQCDYRVPPVPAWAGAYEPPEEFVPWPWSAVEIDRDAGTVSCWNRTYAFGDQPLPSSVRAGERELLGGPISLHIRASGADVRWASGTVDVVRASPSEATVVKTGSAGDLDVTVETAVEYDGYARCRILLTPRKPVEVSDVCLEMPLREEWIRFFHVDGNWGDKLFGAIEGHEALPALETEHHYYWLGDDDAGFCWLAEERTDWRPGTGRSGIGFEKKGSTWIGYVRPIGTVVTVGTPLQFEIGFQATPTRPPPPRPLRALLCYNTPPEKLHLPVSRMGDTVLEMSLKGKMNYPPFPEEAEKIRTWIAGHKAKGMKFVGYQYIDAGTETDAYDAYWGDWVAAIPPDTVQWRTLTAKCCLDSSWSDYSCWTLDRMMTEFDTDGVYLDGIMARECHRGAAHGHRDTVEWPFAAAREHAKKLLYVARKNKGADSILFGHVSLGTIAPLAGLLDLHLKGENYGSPLDYDSLTPDVVRAEFGRQWGPPSVILPQLTKKQSIPASRLLGLAALHGVDCAPSFLPPEEREELLFGMWTIYEDFRIDTATFHPYWHQDLFREIAGRPVSLYARVVESRYLLVIANQTDASARFEIVPRGDLSLTDARERLGDRTIGCTSDKLTTDLEPWEFQLVEVSAGQ
jgi:hypothetical protein